MAENNIEDRVPHSYEAEKSVISCVLQNNDLIDEVFASLTFEMFYDPIFKAMFRSIGELKEQGFSIDTITLKDQTVPKATPSISDKIYSIKAKVVEQGFDANKLDDSFFADILRAAPISANVMTYCNLVKEKFLLRRAIDLSERIILDCRRGEKNAKDICNDAQNGFYNFTVNISDKDIVKLNDFVPEILEDLSEAAKTKDGITGVRSGFKLMDSYTSGFQKTDMIVLAGRPGMGKTAFALNLAYNVCHFNKQKVLFFSLEMGGKQLANRVLSSVSTVQSQTLRTGKLNNNQWKDFMNGIKILHETEFYVDDNPFLTIADLRNKCMKQKTRVGLDIVFIDYLQLMHAGTSYRNSGNTRGGFMNRQEEVSEISRNIKGLAKELNVPIIALSQLSRDAENRTEPQLSDLRESGAIEQDADIVMLIHRPKDEEDDLKTIIKIAKHRNGAVGDIPLRFDKTTARFNELDNHT